MDYDEADRYVFYRLETYINKQQHATAMCALAGSGSDKLADYVYNVFHPYAETASGEEMERIHESMQDMTKKEYTISGGRNNRLTIKDKDDDGGDSD